MATRDVLEIDERDGAAKEERLSGDHGRTLAKQWRCCFEADALSPILPALMGKLRRISGASTALLALALLACGGQSAASGGPKNAEAAVDTGVAGPGTKGSDVPPNQGEVVASPPASGSTNPVPGPFACRLPAPLASDDTCSRDADCAPAEPCHARACVAVAHAHARGPDTVCTMSIDCQSADVNRCACYEGRCSLVPPSP